MLRNRRIVFRRTVQSGPKDETCAPREETTLVVNFLQFVGAGWHTTADALLANASAAMAREHQQAAREALTAWPRERPSTVKASLTPNQRGTTWA